MRCMELLREHSIRLVVFDMDQTAVAAHSRGRNPFLAINAGFMVFQNLIRPVHVALAVVLL
jgi:phosphoserine phosphatase